MKSYLISLFAVIIAQVVGVFGVFFLLGFILAKIQKATNKHYTKTIGWRGIYITAWIGTPVHEFGHIFFAKIFKHKIDAFSLFSPNPDTGGLGYVHHSHNKHSFYQNLGNFFIGSAPMIFGAITLVSFLFLLVPNAQDVLAPLQQTNTTISSLLIAITSSIAKLFSLTNLRSGSFWLFLYLSFCVSSHMAPSKQDRKNMWHGAIWFFGLLLIINSILLLFNIDPRQYIANVLQHLSAVFTIFLYALIIAIAHYIISTLLVIVPKKLWQTHIKKYFADETRTLK
tara:strand:- start:716 stop:1564 length:849 start_codon:yes stop_codon:yes gene_type:complete